MNWIGLLKYSKILLWIGLGLNIMFFYNKYINAIEKSKRLEQNASNEVKKESTGFSEQVLTVKEAKEKIYYSDPYLKNLLEENNIEIRRLKQLITTQNEFFKIDTTKYILNEILKGVRENRTAKQRVVSQDSCYLVGANVHFNGQDMYLDSLEVRTMTRTDIIASVPKIKWYLPWKWFKKRKATITVIDKCGKSQTTLIDLIKK